MLVLLCFRTQKGLARTKLKTQQKLTFSPREKGVGSSAVDPFILGIPAPCSILNEHGGGMVCHDFRHPWPSTEKEFGIEKVRDTE